MSHVLQRIVDRKWDEIAAARGLRPAVLLEQQAATAPPVRDFLAALRGKHPLGLIAEVKKASPSAGVLREDFDPVAIAKTYEEHGAACISVLTDEPFFQGHLDDLRNVRAAVSIPCLRKDFIVDRYQVLEARAAGADCILLIAECLNDAALEDLYRYAGTLGMQCLIEIYEPENLERVLRLQPALLGINNRDLKAMKTDLVHSFRLRDKVPRQILLVSESGIHTRRDVEQLQSIGIHAILVGETFMRAADIGAKVDELLRIEGLGIEGLRD